MAKYKLERIEMESYMLVEVETGEVEAFILSEHQVVGDEEWLDFYVDGLPPRFSDPKAAAEYYLKEVAHV